MYRQLPDLGAWELANDTSGDPSDGGDMAEVTEVLDLNDMPEGRQIIVHSESPRPDAQMRFADVDGCRVAAFD